MLLTMVACRANVPGSAAENGSSSEKGSQTAQNGSYTQPPAKTEADAAGYNGDSAFEAAYSAGIAEKNIICRKGEWSYEYSYYSSGNTNYTLFSRDNGDALERLYVLPDKWRITYSENSFERSSERNIYLYLEHEFNCYDGWNTKLCMIDCGSGAFTQLYDKAVTEMVIPDDPAGGCEAIGWVIHEQQIIPVNLADGSVLQARVFDISARVSLPEISGSFFYYPSAGYQTKIAHLSVYNDDTLLITVTESDPDDGRENEIRYLFSYPDAILTRTK